MKCIECGHELKDGAIFCIRCGAMQVSMDGKPLEAKSAAESGAHAVGMKPSVAGQTGRGFDVEPPRNGGKIAALIAALIVAAALIAFFAFSCIGQGQSGVDESQSTSTETTTSTESASTSTTSTSASATSASASAASASAASASAASASAASAAAQATPEIVNPTPQPEPQPQPQPEPQPAPTSNSYVLGDTSSRYYSRGELEGMSVESLYYARNEIFARHGRMFARADLQAYFDSQSWYTRVYTPEQWESMGNQLNDYELKNAQLMREVEAAKGSPYL